VQETRADKTGCSHRLLSVVKKISSVACLNLRLKSQVPKTVREHVIISEGNDEQ